MNKGVWISFEGIDGAGKSTHIDALAQAFRSQGRILTITREPGGTDLAEQLRTLLLNVSMDPLSESLIAFAARRDHLKRVIEPAIERGETVLCDRFSDATFAYQGAGRGVDWQLLTQLEHMTQCKSIDDLEHSQVNLWQPDLTVWFDLAPEIAAQRLQSARSPDRFESESLDFFTRVQSGYAKRASEHPERFLRIDASLTKHEVWQQLTRGLIQRGWLSIATPSMDFKLS
jgi:dTMP kinase